ncbi:deoxyribose-phosphate aldolase [Bacteroidota bacterium]
MDKVKQIAKMIDHSILHPTFDDEKLKDECKVALTSDVASVCVKPYAVKQAVAILNGSDVAVGCVIGFPHGNSATNVKVFETEIAIQDGAKEIDMVINIGKALQGDWEYIEEELEAVAAVTKRNDAILKVIFENDYMPDDSYIIKLCELCTKTGCDYVKTSSGFGFVKQPNGDYNYKGATLAHLKLMRKHSGPEVKVKAAGGVRDLDYFLEVMETGTTRVGATATISILEEAKKRFG